MHRTPRTLVGGLALGVVVWYVLVAFWAVRPMTDDVPLSQPAQLAETVDGLPERSQAVSCHAPVSRDTQPRGEVPEPVYTWDGSDYRTAFEREPCTGQIEDAWRLLLVDTAVLLGAVVVVGALWFGRSGAGPEGLSAGEGGASPDGRGRRASV